MKKLKVVAKFLAVYAVATVICAAPVVADPEPMPAGGWLVVLVLPLVLTVGAILVAASAAKHREQLARDARRRP